MSQGFAGEGAGTSVGVVVGLVAVAVLLIGCTSLLLLCRNAKNKDGSAEDVVSLQPSSSILEEGHDDNGLLGGTPNEEVLGNATENESPNDDLVESTFARAEHFFPDLDLDLETVKEYRPGRFGGYYSGAASPTDYVKAVVMEHVQGKLDRMNLIKREHLMKRENAAEFCVELGMNPEVVEVKFEATRKFEEELGFAFKTPILDVISHLINQLDYDNPFGEVNNVIQEYNEKAKMLPSLSYMGVEATCGKLRTVIESLEQALKGKGLAGCFMHGTTATNLGKIADLGYVLPSNCSLQPHDFGAGLYCFKGQLEGALSYAFARSWPNLKSQGKKVNINKITKDNPSVIVFRNGSAPEDQTFRVGFSKYPYSHEQLQRYGKRYRSHLEKMSRWDTTNANDLDWKFFVKLARYLKIVPKEWEIFRGWLHDSDCLDDTDRCAEPKIDFDRWEQYCFREPIQHLGQELLFIELFIDWAEWVGRVSNKEDLTVEKEKTLKFLTNETSIRQEPSEYYGR